MNIVNAVVSDAAAAVGVTDKRYGQSSGNRITYLSQMDGSHR